MSLIELASERKRVKEENKEKKHEEITQNKNFLPFTKNKKNNNNNEIW